MAITIDGTNGLSSDNAALKLDGTTLAVDETNNRVGVGTASPAVAMDVVGQVRASTGILFGSDTAAANALDDYEEGTWTGTLGGTVDPTTPVTTTGYYTKIGDIVWASIAFNNVNTTGASGGVFIGGLPFTSASGIRSMGSAMSYQFNFNSLTSLSAYVDSGSTNIVPFMSGNNANWGDLLHNAGSGRYLWAAVVYKV